MTFFSRSSQSSKVEALNRAIDSDYESIYCHVRRLVIDHDDARDIVQETYLKACSSIDSLKSPEAVKAWLYRIATNLALNALKSGRTRSLVSEEHIPDVAEDAPAEPDPRLSFLDRAILQLTPAQRSVFDLRHFDEMSFKEIAGIVGGSPDTVRVVYHQAKEKMKRFLTAVTSSTAWHNRLFMI